MMARTATTLVAMATAVAGAFLSAARCVIKGLKAFFGALGGRFSQQRP
jgi:hypothetical protein